MDQAQLERFAEIYRQMRDEQLATLLDEQSTLTEEAKQALLDVVAERPEVTRIRLQAMDEAQAQVEKQAKQEASEAKADAQFGGVRPAPGFWLRFLTVTLFGWAIWRSISAYTAIWIAETQAPHLFDADAFLAFRIMTIAIVTTILTAAGIAIHAVHAGKTRRHLWRIVAMLWYVMVGAFLIHSAALIMLMRPIDDRLRFSTAPFVGFLVVALIVSSLWTAYLLRSRRCRLRYPRAGEEPVRRVFD